MIPAGRGRQPVRLIPVMGGSFLRVGRGGGAGGGPAGGVLGGALGDLLGGVSGGFWGWKREQKYCFYNGSGMIPGGRPFLGGSGRGVLGG